jgi:hypothetical protein
MGKNDMPDDYAQEWADNFKDTTVEDAREQWDKDIGEVLSKLRVRLTQSTSLIFPLKCPSCESYEITVVFGTNRQLECLSCRKRYRINDIN